MRAAASAGTTHDVASPPRSRPASGPTTMPAVAPSTPATTQLPAETRRAEMPSRAAPWRSPATARRARPARVQRMTTQSDGASSTATPAAYSASVGRRPSGAGEVREHAVREHRFERASSLTEAVGQDDRALQVQQHADHRGGLSRRSGVAQRPRHDQVHDEADQRGHGQRAGERRPERQPAVRQAQPDRYVEGAGQDVEQREDEVALPCAARRTGTWPRPPSPRPPG